MALIRAVRSNSRIIVPHLGQLVAVVIHVLDPALPALRKICLQTAMAVSLHKLPRDYTLCILRLFLPTLLFSKCWIGYGLLDSTGTAKLA